MKPLPSQQLLWTLLSYEPATGLLRWRKRDPRWFNSIRDCNRWNATYAGKEALIALDSRGYKRGAILKGRYPAHRIVWKYIAGGDPPQDIDHVNGNKQDNRFENLRTCSRQENSCNQRRRKNNTSGVVGVDKLPSGQWRAQVGWNGGNNYLGSYETMAEAVAARKAAEKVLGFHPNHGRD